MKSKILASGAFWKITIFLPLLFLLFYPIICRYDFSKSTFWYYDFISMNFNTVPFLIILLVIVAMISVKHHDLPFSCLLAIIYTFSIVEIYSNYPLVWRDVYLHGSSVKAIIDKGQITNVWNTYSRMYPGFFLFSAIFTLISGLDLVPSNLLLLLPSAITLIVFLLSAFYKKLSLRLPSATALLAFVFMNFNTNEFTFFHFSPRLLSFVYFIIFLYLFVCKFNREKSIGFFVIFFALVITHPINSVLPIAFLTFLCCYLERRNRKYVYPFLMFTIIYILWLENYGYLLLSRSLTNLFNFKSAAKTIQAWAPKSSISKPLLGSILNIYYKLLMIIFTVISIYSIIKFKKLMEVKILACYLLSVILVYGLLFPSLGDISVNRGIIIGSGALASLSLILFNGSQFYTSKRWQRHVIISVILILTVPAFIFVHELPISRYLKIGSIDSACYFILNYRSGQYIVSLGDFPIYYCYYEPFYDDYINLGFKGWASLNDVANFLLTSPDSSLKIIDYRKIIDWGAMFGRAPNYIESQKQWENEVYLRIESNSRYNRIYSNGFETIYK